MDEDDFLDARDEPSTSILLDADQQKQPIIRQELIQKHTEQIGNAQNGTQFYQSFDTYQKNQLIQPNDNQVAAANGAYLTNNQFQVPQNSQPPPTVHMLKSPAAQRQQKSNDMQLVQHLIDNLENQTNGKGELTGRKSENYTASSQNTRNTDYQQKVQSQRLFYQNNQDVGSRSSYNHGSSQQRIVVNASSFGGHVSDLHVSQTSQNNLYGSQHQSIRSKQQKQLAKEGYYDASQQDVHLELPSYGRLFKNGDPALFNKLQSEIFTKYYGDGLLKSLGKSIVAVVAIPAISFFNFFKSTMVMYCGIIGIIAVKILKFDYFKKCDDTRKKRGLCFKILLKPILTLLSLLITLTIGLTLLPLIILMTVSSFTISFIRMIFLIIYCSLVGILFPFMMVSRGTCCQKSEAMEEFITKKNQIQSISSVY